MKKSFFLFSFLPALAYWYLETYYPVHIAVIGGLVLATVEVLCEKIFTRHVHELSKFNFIIMLLLGGISLIAHEGIWFKLQPFFTGIAIALYLLWLRFHDKSLLVTMAESMQHNKRLPNNLLKRLERDLVLFFILYSFFMVFVAVKLSTSTWLFFKTGGLYLIFIIFSLLEVFLIRAEIRKGNQ